MSADPVHPSRTGSERVSWAGRALAAALLGAMIGGAVMVARRAPPGASEEARVDSADPRSPGRWPEVPPTGSSPKPPVTPALEKTLPVPPGAPIGIAEPVAPVPAAPGETPSGAPLGAPAGPPEDRPPVFQEAPPVAPRHHLCPGLMGEYFDIGRDLASFPDPFSSERPQMRRIDVDIDFARSLKSFAKAEFTVCFYVRWTGHIRIPHPGKYGFSTVSDDGSRVFIDGRPVVDNGGLHVMLEARGDVDLAAGDHELRVEYFQNFQYAGCKFTWQPEGGPKEIVPESVLFHPSPERDGEWVPGLVGEYFESERSLSDLPDASQWSRPSLTRVDRRIDFGSSQGVFAAVEFREQFFARWTGRISIPKRGIYRFFTESDDGSRLLIDDRVVVDNRGLHGMREAAGEAALGEGPHELRLEYFQNRDHVGLRLLWQSGAGPKEVIPREAFFHDEEFPSAPRR